MDWKIFLSVFGTVFLAEMGDKTQLAAVFMTAKTGQAWTVLAASVLALTAATIIGVSVGALMGQVIPLDWLNRIAGTGFIIIGLIMVMGWF